MKKYLFSLFILIFVLCIFCGGCAAGNNEPQNDNVDGNKNVGRFDSNTQADESLFVWEGNLIAAITADGSKRESILIPARCEGFSGVIFQGTKIKYVAFEDDDDIALDFAFMGADNIVSVELPNELKVIPYSAFQGCDALSTISLPRNIDTIEGYSFNGCINLEMVTFEGDKLTVIGENSFENCASLKSVTHWLMLI